MARNFVLTGSLNLVPGNIKPAVDKIRSDIQGALANISIKLDIKKGQTAQIAKYSASIDKLSVSLDGLSTKATAAASALNTLNGATGGTVKGVNSANKGLTQTAKTMSSVTTHAYHAANAAEAFGHSIGLALKRQTAFIVGTTAIFGIVGATALAIRDAITFEKEMVKVSQVTGDSVKQLDHLNDTIRNLSISLGVSSDDLTIAAQTLSQAELSTRDTATALQALAKADLAPTFDSIEETTEGLIATMKQFGLQARDFEGALGSMNAVAGAFAVESADLVTAIKRSGAAFAQAGQGLSGGPIERLNEFLALITTVRSTTRESAETIGTGLRTIIARIQRPATISFLKQFGVDLTDAEGRFVGAYEAFKRLSEAFNDPRLARTPKLAAVTEELGGFRQLQKVIPLLTQFGTAQEALDVGKLGTQSLTDDAIKAQESLANQIAKVREEFKKLIADIFLSEEVKTFTKGILFLTKTFLGLLNSIKLALPLFAAIGVKKLFSNFGDISKGFKSAFIKASTALDNLNVDVNSPEAKAVRQKENTSALQGNTNAILGLTSAIKILYASRTPVLPMPIGVKRASGGFVGGSGKGDKIPALLEPKEFVIRRSAAEQIGAANLSYMNKTGKLPRFKNGGLVGLQGGSTDPKELNFESFRFQVLTFAKNIGKIFDISEDVLEKLLSKQQASSRLLEDESGKRSAAIVAGKTGKVRLGADLEILSKLSPEAIAKIAVHEAAHLVDVASSRIQQIGTIAASDSPASAIHRIATAGASRPELTGATYAGRPLEENPRESFARLAEDPKLFKTTIAALEPKLRKRAMALSLESPAEFAESAALSAQVPGQFVGMMQSSKRPIATAAQIAASSSLTVAKNNPAQEALIRELAPRAKSERILRLTLDKYNRALANGLTEEQAAQFARKKFKQANDRASVLLEKARVHLPTLFGPPGGGGGGPPGLRHASTFGGRLSERVEGARNFLSSGKGFGLALAGGIASQSVIGNLEGPTRVAAEGLVSTIGTAATAFSAAGPWGLLIGGVIAGASAINNYNKALEEAARSRSFAALDRSIVSAAEELQKIKAGSGDSDFNTVNAARQAEFLSSFNLLKAQAEPGFFQDLTSSFRGPEKYTRAAVGADYFELSTTEQGQRRREVRDRAIRGTNLLELLNSPEFVQRNQQNADVIRQNIERNVATGSGQRLSEIDLRSLALAGDTTLLQQALRNGEIDTIGFEKGLIALGRSQEEAAIKTAKQNLANLELAHSLGALTAKMKTTVQDIKEVTVAYQLQTKAMDTLVATAQTSVSLATSGKAATVDLQSQNIGELLGTRAGQGRLQELFSTIQRGAALSPEQSGIFGQISAQNDRFLTFQDRVKALAQDTTSSDANRKAILEQEMRALVGDLGGNTDIGQAIEQIIKQAGGEEDLQSVLLDPSRLQEILGPMADAFKEAGQTQLDIVTSNANKLGQAFDSITQILDVNNELMAKSFAVGREQFDLGIQRMFGPEVNPMLFRTPESLIQEQRAGLILRTGGANADAVARGDIATIASRALETQTRLNAANQLLQQGGQGIVSSGGRQFGMNVQGVQRNGTQFSPLFGMPGGGIDPNLRAGEVFAGQGIEGIGTNFDSLVVTTKSLAKEMTDARSQLQYFADGLEKADIQQYLDALFGERSRLAGLGETALFGSNSDRRSLRRFQTAEQKLLTGGADAFGSLTRREREDLQRFQGSLRPEAAAALQEAKVRAAQNFGTGFQSPVGNLPQEIANAQAALADAQARQKEAMAALQQLNADLIENIVGAIPETVTVQGFQEVEVRLTGADTLKAIQGELTNTVFAMLIQELNNRLPPGQA